MSENNRRQAVWNWKIYFGAMELRGGETVLNKGLLRNYKEEDRYIGADVSGFCCEIEEIPDSYTSCIEDNSRQRLAHSEASLRNYRQLSGNVQDGVSQWYCDCSMFETGKVCRHLAALALYREKLHGELRFTETDAEFEIRRQAEEEERLKRLAEEEKKRKQAITSSAEDLFKDLPVRDDAYFNVKEAVKGFSTDAYELEVLSSLKSSEWKLKVDMNLTKDNGQVLSAEEYIGERTSITMSQNELLTAHCGCGRSYVSRRSDYWYYPNSKQKQLCGHMIRLLTDTADYIEKFNPGDATDWYGRQFLNFVQKNTVEMISPQEIKPEKRKEIILEPRVVRNDDETFNLTFTARIGATKPYVIRNLSEMIYSWESEGSYKLSGKTVLDFEQSDFAEESTPWLSMLAGKSREISDYNSKLNRHSWYYTQTISMAGDIALKNSVLDDFYEITRGTRVNYADRKEGSTGLLAVNDFPCRILMNILPIHNGGRLSGIAVSGTLPSLIRGNLGEYIYYEGKLGRITPEQKNIIRQLQTAVEKGTDFFFQIGVNNLQEFYYRILPSLTGEQTVIVHDEAAEEAAKFLPPEPSFRFLADCINGFITLTPIVKYGDESFELTRKEESSGRIRDAVQENRVLSLLNSLCDDSDRDAFTIAAGDPDCLYRFLTSGIDLLSRFGPVHGTESFYAFRVKPMPRIVTSVSVSMDSGLLDLEIKTDDLTPGELLELLDSYRKRKKYHRLRSGDFIDLSDTQKLSEIDDAMGKLDMRIEDIITGKGHIPAYRALYVDQLLSEHDSLDIRKNRAMKSLIRNFNTVKDADYDVGDSLSSILRPYQLYGFRWFNVLADCGFGGILADEMGLGKTVQFLSFVDSYVRQTEKDSRRPSLVICPASLVYNWVEEAERFVPDLSVKAVSGSTRERNRIFKDLENGECADLYITSYDLLKRDIVSYHDIRFAACVLDEAQYIKNQKTSAAKSVKVIQAKYRFALTGTPIENRLSEIWSIFDFLMPGFLYDHRTFEQMFEIPVMKKKDQEAGSKLKKMISPFILRRLKSDVLKDLPDKLEEVRYAQMADEQRKVYDAQVVQLITSLSAMTDKDKIAIFAQLTKLRQICCDPSLLFENYAGGSAKREACMDLIRSAIDGGHRILLFSQFTSMLALLEEDLKGEKIKYFKITGSTPKEERLELVHEFNDSKIPVFLISLKAGGTGLNLTGADIVIHYDPWWNLAAQNQATDRAHRIGQEKEVTVYRLIARDTIEEKILDLQNMKKDLADSLIDENTDSIMSLSTEELLELLS